MPEGIKTFLYPNKEKNELDTTTTVVITTQSNIKRNESNKVVLHEFKQVEFVANQIVEGKTVVVDLTQAELSEARRICDFLNGVCFALDYKIEKVAKLIYLFTKN